MWALKTFAQYSDQIRQVIRDLQFSPHTDILYNKQLNTRVILRMAVEVVNQRVSLMWLPSYGKLSKTCWRISGEKIMIVGFSNPNIHCLTECIGVGFFCHFLAVYG